MTKKELEMKRLQAIFELGEHIYLRYRAGAFHDDEEFQPYFAKLAAIDKEIGQSGGKIYFSNHLTTCPNCNQPLKEKGLFCTECGFSIKDFLEQFTKVCPICHAMQMEGNVFCEVCGTRL